MFINHDGPANRVAFLDGKLGVLRPTFQPRHLIAAFRFLSRVPLTQAEKESLYEDQRDIGASPSYPYPPQRWSEARQTVPGTGPAPDINPYAAVRGKGLIQSFENCKTNAFDTAVAALGELRVAWGQNDARLLDWVHAQDQVFLNCSAGTPSIPPPSRSRMRILCSAASRRYQIAAALLYAGRFRRRCRRV